MPDVSYERVEANCPISFGMMRAFASLLSSCFDEAAN